MANVIAGNSDDEFGTLTIEGSGVPDPAAFLLGFASPTVPMIPIASDNPDVTLIGIEGDESPLFIFRDGVCSFRKVARWRRIVSHVIFLHALHLRSDVLFFHAASVNIEGKGVMLIGPKGSGKSTASLALASRGHALLGDETAAYEVGTGSLLPMRRPVGIKPGPRARRIDRAMANLSTRPDEDGMTRIAIDAFFAGQDVSPTPLRAAIFLDGFADVASLRSVVPGRDEISAMQPMRSSTFGAKPALRVFEMIRLLGSVACYRLTAADPDYTAQIIEETLLHGALG